LGSPYWWRHRWRGGRGRKPIPRRVSWVAGERVFIPLGVPQNREPVYLFPDELEALRLVYLEGKTQNEAAETMSVSRGTLWRLLDSARRKVVTALVEGRPLIITSRPRP